MSEGSVSPKRLRLEYDDGAKDEHLDKYNKNRDQDDQGSYSNSRKRRVDIGDDDDDIKDSDDIKSKSGGDASRREQTLVMRLTNKEQELQDCMNQIQEMKQAQTQNTAQLRSMLLDPAINLVFQRMSKEMEEHKEKLKLKQNELNAWKFTPDSQTGRRLMSKCRMLLQENEELGKMISSGRTARLEGEISLHKALVVEMKKNQKELDEFVGELEEDVEGMQGMIFMLQQQLKEAREQISRLQQENEQLRTLQLPTDFETAGVYKNGIGADDKNTFSSSSQRANSNHSSTDHVQTKSLSSLIHVTNPMIPLSNSSDSAIASNSTDELSPGSFSLKVTPDSGIHTQEEDDNNAVDSVSVDECGESNSASECHKHPSDSETRQTVKKPNSCLEDGARTCNQSDIGNIGAANERTSPHGVENSDCPANNSLPISSSVPERTSSPALINANGDIQLTATKDSESCFGVGGDKRTPSGEEVKGYSKDRTEGSKVDVTFTHNNENTEDIRECLGLNEECPTVNSF